MTSPDISEAGLFTTIKVGPPVLPNGIVTAV
jgi:hypothetical protein